MEALAHWLWIPGWAAVGAAAYAVDARFGVPFRASCVNLCSATPKVTTTGFVSGRSSSVKLVWSIVLAANVAVLGSVFGTAAWYAAIAGSLLDALACWAGMHLAPGIAWIAARAGRALDGLDLAEAGVRASVPSFGERAATLARSAAAILREAASNARMAIGVRVAPQVQAAPRPTFEEERQAKIDRMDGLLGRR